VTGSLLAPPRDSAFAPVIHQGRDREAGNRPASGLRSDWDSARCRRGGSAQGCNL